MNGGQRIGAIGWERRASENTEVHRGAAPLKRSGRMAAAVSRRGRMGA